MAATRTEIPPHHRTINSINGFGEESRRSVHQEPEPPLLRQQCRSSPPLLIRFPTGAAAVRLRAEAVRRAVGGGGSGEAEEVPGTVALPLLQETRKLENSNSIMFLRDFDE